MTTTIIRTLVALVVTLKVVTNAFVLHRGRQAFSRATRSTIDQANFRFQTKIVRLEAAASSGGGNDAAAAAAAAMQQEPLASVYSGESAATVYSGAGPVKVDMNVYNLPLEEIAEEWTATLVPETAMQEAGIYLGARTEKLVFVDSFKVEFTRKRDQGLGMELLEIAGGREDGYGITIVSGLVAGGSADGSPIREGDSISKVAVVRTNGSTGEREEVASVATECLGFDRTVEMLSSLPPCSSQQGDDDDEESFLLTIKRLRRKPKVELLLQYPPEQNEPDIRLELFSGENLRRAMLVRGVKLNDPLARRFDSGGSGDCGAEGTCATCAVSISRGDHLLSPRGTTEEQLFKDTPRWRLSCKAVVGYGMQEGEIVLRVNPRQWL